MFDVFAVLSRAVLSLSCISKYIPGTYVRNVRTYHGICYGLRVLFSWSMDLLALASRLLAPRNVGPSVPFHSSSCASVYSGRNQGGVQSFFRARLFLKGNLANTNTAQTKEAFSGRSGRERAF